MVVEELSRDMAVLEKRIEAADVAAIQAISHRMKGTCANARLVSIALPAGEMNDLVKRGYDAVRCRELLAQLQAGVKALAIHFKGADK